MGNLTIKDIRKLAELNLTPECYKIYLQIIEPNVKSLIPDYLRDWQNVESYVNMAVMRHMGVFKTELSFFSIDEDAEKKYRGQLDVIKFREIKPKSFKWKIDYLYDNGILGHKSHELLDLLRKKRNEKIHEMGAVFSEKELQEFSMAYSTIFYIYTSMDSKISDERREQIRDWVEKSSEELLKIL